MGYWSSLYLKTSITYGFTLYGWILYGNYFAKYITHPHLETVFGPQSSGSLWLNIIIRWFTQYFNYLLILQSYPRVYWFNNNCNTNNWNIIGNRYVWQICNYYLSKYKQIVDNQVFICILKRTIVVHIDLDRVSNDRQGRRPRNLLDHPDQARSLLLIKDHNCCEDRIKGNGDGREVCDALDHSRQDYTLSK